MAIKGDILYKDFEEEPTELYFSGWDIEDLENLIVEVLEEQINPDERIIIKSYTHKKIAYSTSKYLDEIDANDEGYNYWFIWKDTWKKGCGKCTLVEVNWMKQDALKNK